LSFPIPSTYNSTTITITIRYSLGTRLNLTVPLLHKDQYRVDQSRVPGDIQTNYESSTTYVESDDDILYLQASVIANGKTDLQIVVEDLAKWIAGNITYDNSHTCKKSTDVYNYKTGDCEGQSHLMAAFCRSLAIPVRITVGNSFPYQMNVPLWNGYRQYSPGANGTVNNEAVGHAVYEVFYPTMQNWVRGDAVNFAANFGWPTMIKSASGPDGTISNWGGGNISHPQNQHPVLGSSIAFSTTVGSFTNTLKYEYNDIFTGALKNVYLFGINDKTPVVGEFDYVKISEPPANTPGPPDGSIMPPNTLTLALGSKASFYANFTSYSGDTYPVSWDWEIKLYYNGGTYSLIAENLAAWLDTWRWTPTISGTLPNYDWVLDSNGNIYGEVTATVHINDGYTKSDKISIGVVPPPCIPSITNTTITTNTTINGCSDFTLQNVTIQNNASLNIIPAGNTTVNGPFDVQQGSAFEVKK